MILLSNKTFRWVLWMLVFYTGIPAFVRGQDSSWIRVNQLGYATGSVKVAVLVWKGDGGVAPGKGGASEGRRTTGGTGDGLADGTGGPPRGKQGGLAGGFELVNADNAKVVFRGDRGKDFGVYGPFGHGWRLNFSGVRRPGRYFLRCGTAVSPVFMIGGDVYAGTPDFVLRYLRQQRSGFNPFLRDSCHTHDGYTMYGPMPDTTRIDVSGGWHDATDYLQYVTTSANATWCLLSGFAAFPEVFGDSRQANGLEGANGVADVLDEGKWGLDWLLKMHPRPDWLFHQLADDRDHHGYRLPSHDSVDYGVGAGMGRPVYFATGRPQGLGKYQNHSTGVANIAGKVSSAFALGSMLYARSEPALSVLLREKALSAWALGRAHPGVCQTAPNREPYYYEEANWVDDMELAAAQLFRLTGDSVYFKEGVDYGRQEPVTPWMGADTARHYQWYPFNNFGHFELPAKAGKDYYRRGIDSVWQKARKNAFFRGVPFIWCSNNLTVAFAIQCYLYRQMTGDVRYAELEQASFDWIFGCNPWGKSMVYGLPAQGDTPKHPHSSLSYLYGYPLDGGMVDGPVYGSIYKNLRGLKLYEPDKYAAFQSPLVVYHDDAGDYSTNEPTMDGTASLVWLLAAKQHEVARMSHGGVIRGDMHEKKIALVFTGDEFADGGEVIAHTLSREQVRASFFLTGNFYRNTSFGPLIRRLKAGGHYLGSHSDKHLLYCDWNNRDSLLVSRGEFDKDLKDSYREMKKWGVGDGRFFLPSYEWYNDSISRWAGSEGLQLVNMTPGTRSNADYTYPEMGRSYVDSDSILRSILQFEQRSPAGLNGFILLTHIGVDPRRTDKFYLKLDELIVELKHRGYQFERIDQLLKRSIPTLHR